uniref:Centromere protein Cenp-F N-terminal domain-containing protein n=1 Tax=Sinocyclocheilus anshuiensis TaxID=1608454 RepID=A0A671R6S0_9TELE
MSWAVEEWKDGLPAKKQFQLDSLEATLQKQRQKVSYLRSSGGLFSCWKTSLRGTIANKQLVRPPPQGSSVD